KPLRGFPLRALRARLPGGSAGPDHSVARKPNRSAIRHRSPLRELRKKQQLGVSGGKLTSRH
ncbi:hypothetical protein, partial [Streptomyces sp. NBC_00028]|uniref:hypothetical protein n=1 Tax=Streptomyces sp. NBC_00028 TaxID=2975624 RepID=UPI00386A7648